MRELNVFVNKKLVGVLTEDMVDGAPLYTFEYTANKLKPVDAVSVAMPVSKKRYVSRELHHVFRQNFPEGERLVRLQKLGRFADVSDDFSILGIVGQTMVGRVSVSTGKTPPDSQIPDISLHDVTARGAEIFRNIVTNLGATQGVSGVQEKILVDDDTGERTAFTNRFILKSFDPEQYPALAENEYWTMVASSNSGIETAKVELSADLSVLIVHRFDVRDDGTMLALDEAGALKGFSNSQKYQATYETVVDVVDQYCGDFMIGFRAFFKQLLFNVAVRNNDAHMKNFALLTDGVTRLAPAYDVVTTEAYIGANPESPDYPALSLDNERFEKVWWPLTKLYDFGAKSLMLEQDEMEKMVEEIKAGLDMTMEQMKAARKSQDFEEKVMPIMLAVWSNPFRNDHTYGCS